MLVAMQYWEAQRKFEFSRRFCAHYIQSWALGKSCTWSCFPILEGKRFHFLILWMVWSWDWNCLGSYLASGDFRFRYRVQYYLEQVEMNTTEVGGCLVVRQTTRNYMLLTPVGDWFGQVSTFITRYFCRKTNISNLKEKKLALSLKKPSNDLVLPREF